MRQEESQRGHFRRDPVFPAVVIADHSLGRVPLSLLLLSLSSVSPVRLASDEGRVPAEVIRVQNDVCDVGAAAIDPLPLCDACRCVPLGASQRPAGAVRCPVQVVERLPVDRRVAPCPHSGGKQTCHN